MLAGCPSPAPASGVTYATYTYNCCAEISAGMTSWHPGQHVILHWTAAAGPQTTHKAPRALTLRVTLIGPFASVDALKQAISQRQIPPGVRSIDAATPAVTDRTGGTPELDLPADLPAGYYNLDMLIGSGGNTSGAATIITIE